MRKKYKHPPIVEVVSEIRFSPESEWDITVPGRLFDLIKKDFPKKKEKIVYESSISQKEGEFSQTTRPSPLMWFLSQDDSKIIQAGKNLLSINHLKPYSSWEEMYSIISDNLAKYIKIANPKGIDKITLNYINTINIPKKEIELEKYFDISIKYSNKLSQEHNDFIVGVLFPFNDELSFLKLTFMSTVSDSPNVSSIMLILDYYRNSKEKLGIEDTKKWFENAHNNIEHVFEACIKDPLRELFQEV